MPRARRIAWSDLLRRVFAVERGRALAVGALVAFVAVAAGWLARELAPLREPRATPEEPLRVALVQGGIGGSRLWSGAADLLVNLSNDSWFDDGAGPEQNFALASLRAAETRRPMARVTTTGVSALVGEEGLLSWRLPTGTGAIALLDVVPPHHDSIFTRGGGGAILALLALIGAAAIALPSILAVRLRPHGGTHE